MPRTKRRRRAQARERKQLVICERCGKLKDGMSPYTRCWCEERVERKSEE